MSQKKLEEFPAEIKDTLTDGSQQIFVAAYNSASEDGMSEQAAMNVAWNSIKPYYEKGNDGKWHRKPQVTNIHHKAVTSGGN